MCTYVVILSIPYSHSIAGAGEMHLLHQSVRTLEPVAYTSSSVLRAYCRASDISAEFVAAARYIVDEMSFNPCI